MAGIKGDNPSKEPPLKQELIFRKYISTPHNSLWFLPLPWGRSRQSTVTTVPFTSGDRRGDKGGDRAGGWEQQPLPTCREQCP